MLRGCGRQKQGAVANLVVNWVVGLTLQVVLAFNRGWGITGLWWALAFSSILQSVVLAVLAVRMRWQHETVRAARLVRQLSSMRE